MAINIKGFIIGLLLACVSGLSFAQQAIMPTGDSITGGQSRPSYRLPLLDELAAAGCSVDMVGDQTLNSFDFRDPLNFPGEHVPPFEPAQGYDTDHQAFPGIRTEQLLNGTTSTFYTVSPLSAYVSAEQPDFVLLHTGTNDLNLAISTGTDTAQEIETWANQTTGEVDSMIDQIFASHNNPANLRVLLANFIPYQGPFVNQSQIDAAAQASAVFTQKLEDLVASKGNSRLLLVDVATGFDVATMTTDNVHPNQIGEEHIAGAFLPVLYGAGLCSANNIPFITSPANGDTVNGEPLTITWDDNGFVADNWQVFVGDTQSGNSSTWLDSGVLGTGVRSVTVPSLPQDGSNVFISLNYTSGGVTNQIITRFVSEPAGVTGPTITSPMPGTVLPGSEVTFDWADNGTTATQWYFRFGSTFGGEEYVSTRITNGAQRSAVFSGLPTDGSRVFVEFSHRLPSGVWVSDNLEYDAAGTPVNIPPVAADDSLGPVDVNQTLNLDVLANDTDSDGTLDVSTVIITTQPTEGTATVLPSGQIEYVHGGGTTSGTDTLSYTVSDDDGDASNVALVTITVNDPGTGNTPPIAVDDTVGPVTIGGSLTFDVLTNDSDSDGTLAPGTVTITQQPLAGTAVVEADGQITYTHDGTSGTLQDVLSYTVDDDDGDTSNEAVVTIAPFEDPDPANEAPVATDDTGGPLDAGQSITVNVLANDTDSDGTIDPTTVAIASQPTAGTLVIESDGQITYTHDGSAGTGSDTFTYTVQDDDGATSNAATVTITPIVDPDPENQAPVANDDNDGPVDVGLTITIDVLGNDSDADGTIDPTTVIVASQPTEGTASVVAGGQIEYVHNGDATSGSDTFSYTVQDDDGAVSNEATVTVSVNDPSSSNVPPLAFDDSAGPMNVGDSLTFPVLSNDTDSDGTIDVSSITITGDPQFGTVTARPDGLLVYAHDGSGPGTDFLTYTVRDDGGATSNSATVTINPIQLAGSLPELTDPAPGTQLPGADVTFNWASNTTPVQQWYLRVGLSQGSTEFADIRFTNPATTQLEVNGLPTDGESTVFVEFSYRQGNGWNIRNFEYLAASDGTASPPVAANDTAGPLDAGASITIDVLANDSDEGALVPATVAIVDQPASGTVVVEADGQITYTHDGSAGTGSDTFTYTVQDDDGEVSNAATVTVTPINDPDPQNEPPVATDDTDGPLAAGASITVDVLANDTDSDGTIDPTTVTIASQPSAGTLVVESDGQITYTHDGSAGTVSDTFTYTVLDDDGDISNAATVTITPINDPDPENEAPVAVADTAGPLESGQTITVDVLTNDTDSDGTVDPATVAIASQPAVGTVVIESDGQITYTHDGTPGSIQDVFTYTVQDDDGATSNAATVTITPINDPDPENEAPIAVDDTAGPVEEGQSITVNVLANDTDSDGTVDPATVAIASQPAAGTVVLESGGQITYTHDGTAGTGADTFTYTVQDDDGATSNAATVTITPITEPGPLLPELTDPLPGTQLSGPDVTFMWDDNGVALTQWYLRVGLSEGTTEFADVRIRNAATMEFEVTGLPTNGVPIFVEFSFFSEGAWNTRDFEYQAFDSNGVNQAPVANDDMAGPLNAGQSITVNVLANDTDSDGTLDPATVAIVSQPAAGTVVIESDGQITYTHDGSAGTGSDTFTYTVQDDDGATSNAATVTITPINDPDPENEAPVAAGDNAGPLDAGQSITVNVLANDTDSDGTLDPATVAIASQPAAGTVVVESDGQITYTHDGSAGTGSDSFTYTVQDDDGATSNAATVTITPINDPDPQNEAPVAVDDIAGPIEEGQSITVNVLANDTDSDGTVDPATVAIASQPAAGTVVLESGGQITYTHDGTAGTGSDSFTYTVQDDDGATSNAATVTITPITEPGPLLPELTDPLPGTQLSGPDVTFMWDDNGVAVTQWYLRVGLSEGATEFADVRIRNAATMEFEVTGLPTNGVPVFVEFSFFDGAWNTRDFEYQAFNGNAANQAPLANDDTAGPLITDQGITVNVLANDSDPDGTIDSATVAIASQPAAGTVVVESDGQITYTHDGSAGTGSDTFTYTVQDDDGATSNTATVTITPINDPDPENEAPVATDDTDGPVDAGQSITVNVLANDTDSDGTLDPSTVAIVSQPAAGTVVVESDGQITYTHNGTSGTGSDTFTYTVQDDDGATSNVASVTITPINDGAPQPELTDPLPGTQLADTSVTFNWDANGIAVERWYFRAGLSVGTEEFIGTAINNPSTTQLLVTGLPSDGVTTVHVEFSYQLNGSWITRNFQYTAALVDTPPPVEPPPLVLSEVNWLHADVSGWAETANLSSVPVDLSADQLCLNYDRANTWPAGQPLLPANDAELVANAWVFIWNEDDNVWYGATWEWLRPGQICKTASAVDGIHIKRPPYTAASGWEPTSGETLYFMVSGLARNNTRNVLERSAPFKVIWP